MERKEILIILDSVNLYVIAGLTLVLPLFFFPLTTDTLELPKQILVTFVALLLLILFGIKLIIERKVSFRRTPLDLALALFFVVIAVSMLFSQSHSTSIPAAIPLLSVIIISFLVSNTITDGEKERILVSSALIGGALLALFSILQFLRIYVLPYSNAQTINFSLAGSLSATAIFLVCLIPLGLSFARSYLKKSEDELWTGFFLGTSVLIAIGALLLLYQLFFAAKAPLLPQEIGLRTALQPLGVNFQTALFGTGPGTYLFNFTRFRDVTLNATNLWNLRFTNSSSLFLEILSTLGIIGALVFLFMIFRLVGSFLKDTIHDIRTLGVILSLVLVFLFSFFLPFSIVSLFLLFVLLGLYATRLANEESPQIYDVAIAIVALKKGLITLEREPIQHHPPSDILPYILLGIFLIVAGSIGLGSFTFLRSDMIFQRALIAASSNQAKQTYDLENEAIRLFASRDMYHRVFSQTNFAIASSIALEARNASPSGSLSQQDRQTMVTLVEQSISFGRNAVTLSPLNVFNWESLANIYRGLIGFAQNADQFAITSGLKAVELDPTNPVLRVNLGGIYYQLGQYDIAIREFATATNLKPDYANAYYNLGHAFESKADAVSLQTALSAYQTVRNLVERNSVDFIRIEGEIAALTNKISPPQAQEATASATPTAVSKQEPLKISTPSGTLPSQKPPVPVEGPPGATISAEEKE